MPQTTPHIRSMQPGEHAAVARLLTQAQPHNPISTQDLDRLLNDQRHWGYRHGVLVAAQPGRDPGTEHLTGAAVYSQSVGAYHPDRYALMLGVDADAQRQGVGAALWTAVTAHLRSFGAESVRVDAQEDHPVAPGFLTRRGGVADHWVFPSALDLRTFNPRLFEGVADRLAGLGVTLTTLTELRARPESDLNARLTDLMNRVRVDVPRPEPAQPISVELFEEAILGDFGLISDGYVVAEHAGHFVGQSTLFTNGEGDDLFTGLTGVTREWRRQGLALAMKLKVIQCARTLGAARVVTENASDNAGMLAVNERLGFQRQPATASYLIRLDR